MIFVNSMSDLFYEDIPDAFIRRVFDVMARADRHTFQVLTKRPQRLESLAPRLPLPPNVWMGVTIENRRFVPRADALRATPASAKFISAEPLLGRLEGLNLQDINWLIAGGELCPRHRPMRLEWVRDLRDRYQQEGVAFFFKQLGGRQAGNTIDELPADLRIREMPRRALPDVMRPAAGRLPAPGGDGRTGWSRLGGRRGRAGRAVE
ncbi:MAG: phage Gp37/Gp68 family protein [Actinomycetota bacterium]|nr:phage Gp37/Gp68 family protein [Actinomycetota bacterium]